MHLTKVINKFFRETLGCLMVASHSSARKEFQIIAHIDLISYLEIVGKQ